MDFQIQTQEQSRWCWAAVTVSVELYFSPNSAWTQCNLASAVLPNNPNCCAQPAVCNRAWYLERALSAVGKLRYALLDVLTIDQVRTELRANLPVCVRIGWDNGGGHFVIICGLRRSSSGKMLVDVADPWYLDSTLTYEDFRDRYQHRGEWMDTYLVQP